MTTSRPLLTPAARVRLLGALRADTLERCGLALDAVLAGIEERVPALPLLPRGQDARRALWFGVRERFLATLDTAWAGLVAGQPPSAGHALASGRSGQLGLLDEHELQLQLARAALVAELSRDAAALLANIEQRLAWLGGHPLLEAERNPAGPEHIAAALQVAVLGTHWPDAQPLALFERLARGLPDALDDLLQSLDERLVEEGVLPELRLLGRRAGVRPPRARRERAAPPLPDAELATLVSAVAERLHAWRAREDGPKMLDDSEARPLDRGEVLQALSLLQTGPMPADVVALRPSQRIPRIKAELLAAAERLGLDPLQVRLDDAAEAELELAGRLFDHLVDEVGAAAPSRAVLQRALLPFARAGVLARGALLRREGPVAGLLGGLAEACDGNLAGSEAEKRLLDGARRVVERLCADFNEDLAVFAELEHELEDVLARHRQRVRIAERRAAESQLGQDRLEQARAIALAELAERMPARALTPSLDLLMRLHWPHHVAMAAARAGTGSPAFREALAVGDALLAAHARAAAAQAAPPLLRGLLEPLLVSAGCHGAAASEAVHAIEAELAALARGEAIATEPARALQASRLPPLAAAAPSRAPQRHDPALRLLVGRLQALPVGSWCEVRGEDGEARAVKLAWISPISGRRLLVNRRGQKVLCASPEDLAPLFAAGRLAFVPGRDPLERSLHRMIDALAAVPPAGAAAA